MTKQSWNYHSGIHSCATCDGLGTVASMRRPTVDDPYPESPCPDCDGEYHEAECKVCGSTLEVAGYDCIVCQSVAELPKDALLAVDAIVSAFRTAMGARLEAEGPLA